ncbi:unnamed protein product [Zymoseptoria tritici ST99CH_1A5]|uniref:Uncharacterized protein n=1 Tax=Zymoseptoria tritici ST99CH_1A5 TaxID=1276529 RepID=A0A1Y6LUE6_ZYMTR|nr:unnamed protein product [Zymoseptoria tritici ST99CH_1A5]
MSSTNMDIPELTFEEMLATLTDSVSDNTAVNGQQYAGQPAYTGDLNHQQQAFYTPQTFNTPQVFNTPQNNVANNFNFHTQQIENAYGNVTHNHHQTTPLPMLSHYSDEGLELAIDQQNQRRDRDLRYSTTLQAAPGLQQQHHGFQGHNVLIDQLTANEAASFLSPTLQSNPWAGQQENDFNFGAGGQGHHHYGQDNSAAFDPFSASAPHPQWNDPSTFPLMNDNTQHLFTNTHDDFAQQGFNNGFNQRYPEESFNAELERDWSYKAPPGQFASGIVNRFNHSGQQVSTPSQRTDSGRGVDNYDFGLDAIDGAQELIVLDSDSDCDNAPEPRTGDHTQRVLPTWDPSINDIDSANAWLHENKDELRLMEVKRDDAEEVAAKLPQHARELFNALQAPYPPAPQKYHDRKNGVEYYNNHQDGGLNKVNELLTEPASSKRVQCNAFTVLQMAVDVHRKGLPSSHLEDERKWRAAPSEYKIRCSERVRLILKAVTQSKALAHVVAVWNAPRVEMLVRNPRKSLHSSWEAISSNQNKKSRARPARPARSQSSTPAPEPATSRRRAKDARNSQLKVISLLDTDDDEDLPTSRSASSVRSKRSRPAEIDDDHESQLRTVRPRKRQRAPADFSSEGNFQ